MTTAMLEPGVAPLQPDEEQDLPPEQLGADYVLGEIKKHCLLLYVTVHSYEGVYRIDGAEVSMQGAVVDDERRTAPSWKLVPAEWHKAITPLKSKVQKVITSNAVRFKDGVFIVPRTSAKRLIDAVKAIDTAYRAQGEEFAKAWDGIVAKHKAAITEKHGAAVWNSLQRMLPTKQKLQERFTIEVGLWPVGGQDAGRSLPRVMELVMPAVLRSLLHIGVEPSVATTVRHTLTEALQQCWDQLFPATTEELAEYLDEAHKATQQMVLRAAEAMCNEPLQRLQQAAANLATNISKPGLRDASLEVMRREYELYKGFAFIGPQELLGQLQTIGTTLAQHKAADIRQDGQVADNLLKALHSVSQQAEQELQAVSVASKLGRAARYLTVRPQSGP